MKMKGNRYENNVTYHFHMIFVFSPYDVPFHFVSLGSEPRSGPASRWSLCVRHTQRAHLLEGVGPPQHARSTICPSPFSTRTLVNILWVFFLKQGPLVIHTKGGDCHSGKVSSSVAAHNCSSRAKRPEPYAPACSAPPWSAR